MKIDRVLSLMESISFMAAKYNEEKGYFESGPSGYVEEDCWVCDGSGHDEGRGGECGYCNGKGKIDSPHYEHEPLNVSNMNAGYILRDVLGMEFKESGSISPDRIPEFKRRLMKIKNDGNARSAGVRDISSVGGNRVRGKDESGMDRIGRSAQVVDMGRTSDQVDRYIDDLLEIFDHAQKNGMHVVWH